MNRLVPILLCVLLAQAGWAQIFKAKAPPAAPAPRGNDVSGSYTFLRDGESLRIIAEDDHVAGFISRFGDLPSDKGANIDQFVRQGALNGSKLTFATETLRGTWYEFAGTVERGRGKSPSDEAYYLLKGRLTTHSDPAKPAAEAKPREVEFRSFPRPKMLKCTLGADRSTIAKGKPPHLDIVIENLAPEIAVLSNAAVWLIGEFPASGAGRPARYYAYFDGENGNPLKPADVFVNADGTWQVPEQEFGLLAGQAVAYQISMADLSWEEGGLPPPLPPLRKLDQLLPGRYELHLAVDAENHLELESNRIFLVIE
jgi:hypothetical protein